MAPKKPAKKAPEKKAPLGEGTRFKKLSAELAEKGAKKPDALAAWIGAKKYSRPKMQKLATAGRQKKNR